MKKIPAPVALFVALVAIGVVAFAMKANVAVVGALAALTAYGVRLGYRVASLEVLVRQYEERTRSRIAAIRPGNVPPTNPDETDEDRQLLDGTA